MTKKQQQQQYQREYYLKNKERLSEKKRERWQKNINGYRDRLTILSVWHSRRRNAARSVNETVKHNGKLERLYPMSTANGIRGEFTRWHWQKVGILPKPIYGKKYSESQVALVKHAYRLVDEWYLPFIHIKELLHTFWKKTYKEKEIEEYVKSKGWKPWDGN